MYVTIYHYILGSALGFGVFRCLFSHLHCNYWKEKSQIVLFEIVFIFLILEGDPTIKYQK